MALPPLQNFDGDDRHPDFSVQQRIYESLLEVVAEKVRDFVVENAVLARPERVIPRLWRRQSRVLLGKVQIKETDLAP